MIATALLGYLGWKVGAPGWWKVIWGVLMAVNVALIIIALAGLTHVLSEHRTKLLSWVV